MSVFVRFQGRRLPKSTQYLDLEDSDSENVKSCGSFRKLQLDLEVQYTCHGEEIINREGAKVLSPMFTLRRTRSWLRRLMTIQ